MGLFTGFSLLSLIEFLYFTMTRPFLNALNDHRDGVQVTVFIHRPGSKKTFFHDSRILLTCKTTDSFWRNFNRILKSSKLEESEMGEIVKYVVKPRSKKNI